MLAGLIRDDEMTSLDGIPGLSDLPVIGRIFGHSSKTVDQTDIILTLTPHIVRVLDLNESDLRPYRVGRDSLTPIAELPLLIDTPRPAEPPRQETPNPPPATPPPAAAPSNPLRPGGSR
jgi:general secretion pathway protein D